MRNLVKLEDTESLYLQLQGVSLCISCRLEQYGRNLVEYGLILDIVHCWHVSGLAASLDENAQIMGNLTNENMRNVVVSIRRFIPHGPDLALTVQDLAVETNNRTIF